LPTNLASNFERVKQINTISWGISVENAASCTGHAANRRNTRSAPVHRRKRRKRRDGRAKETVALLVQKSKRMDDGRRTMNE
jgi:hypothetical protein